MSEYAKKANTQESWNYYLESLSYPVDYRVRESWDYYLNNFPKAKCIAEAKAFFDQLICEKARKENNLLSWKAYLEEFPQGKCAEEAKKNIDKMRTIGRLEWSERSVGEKNWYDAVNYCRNLDELGHTDWRLPNIDELRTLIRTALKRKPAENAESVQKTNV